MVSEEHPEVVEGWEHGQLGSPAIGQEVCLLHAPEFSGILVEAKWPLALVLSGHSWRLCLLFKASS